MTIISVHHKYIYLVFFYLEKNTLIFLMESHITTMCNFTMYFIIYLKYNFINLEPIIKQSNIINKLKVPFALRITCM
jgi:hypothetical protein